jgi:hypothetical protein
MRAPEAGLVIPSKHHPSWDRDLGFFKPSAAVSIATSAAEIAEIGSLRYSLLIARDGKDYPSADHRNKQLIELGDAVSANVCVRQRGQIVAAERLTSASNINNDPFLESLTEIIRSEGHTLQQCSLTSRLVVRPDTSARLSLVGLFRYVYAIGLGAGHAHNFISVRENLIPLFERIGFVDIGHNIHVDGAGRLRVLQLNLHDRAHLKRCRSRTTTTTR